MGPDRKSMMFPHLPVDAVQAVLDDIDKYGWFADRREYRAVMTDHDMAALVLMVSMLIHCRAAADRATLAKGAVVADEIRAALVVAGAAKGAVEAALAHMTGLEHLQSYAVELAALAASGDKGERS